jgi:hypothetical protein
VSEYIPEPEQEEDDDQLVYIVSDQPKDHSVRLTRDFSATRNMLAIAIWLPYALIALLLVIGGLLGKFGPEVVDPVVAAYAASATTVVYFYFRHRGPARPVICHGGGCSHQCVHGDWRGRD